MMKNLFMKGETVENGGWLRTFNSLKKYRNPQPERLLMGMFRELSEDKQEIVLDIISDLYAIEKKPL